MEKYGEKIASKGCQLKCLLGTFIIFYVVSICLALLCIFQNYKQFCTEEKTFREDAECPTQATFKRLKYAWYFSIVVILIKIFLSVKLYRAISSCVKEDIIFYLKLIAVLFVVWTSANFILQKYYFKAGYTNAVTMAVCGLVITGSFVWYAWSII